MKLKIIISLIILASLPACRKDQSLPFTFIGTVTDINGDPVPNVTVTLSAYYRGNVISGGGYSRIATVTTDIKGTFKAVFNFDSTANSLMIQAFADNYFPLFSEAIFTNNIQRDSLIQNLSLYKLATIHISFKNSFPVSNADNFHVFQENETFGPIFYTLVARQLTGGTFNELEHAYIGCDVQGYEITKTKVVPTL